MQFSEPELCSSVLLTHMHSWVGIDLCKYRISTNAGLHVQLGCSKSDTQFCKVCYVVSAAQPKKCVNSNFIFSFLSYMVDAADPEKIEASKNELHNLLDKPQLQGIPVRTSPDTDLCLH